MIGLFVLILMSVLYNNNVSYLVSFLLLSIMLISMMLTHFNLQRISVELLEPSIFAFAEDIVYIPARLQTTARDEHHDINLRLFGYDLNEVTSFSFDCSKIVNIHLKHPVSGRFSYKRLHASSSYPFGLFYSWMYIPVKLNAFVMPKAKKHSLVTVNFASQVHGDQDVANNGGLYSSVRYYQNSDPVRHISWRHFSKGQGLITKVFDDGEVDQLPVINSNVHDFSDVKYCEDFSFNIKKLYEQHISFIVNSPFYQGIILNKSDYQALLEAYVCFLDK